MHSSVPVTKFWAIFKIDEGAAAMSAMLTSLLAAGRVQQCLHAILLSRIWRLSRTAIQLISMSDCPVCVLMHPGWIEILPFVYHLRLLDQLLKKPMPDTFLLSVLAWHLSLPNSFGVVLRGVRSVLFIVRDEEKPE
jgi:hypothetical protein